MSAKSETITTQKYPGIESWAVGASFSEKDLPNSALEVYANPDWQRLTVNNPHFNMLHAYDFYSKHTQDKLAVKSYLEIQIESAIAEDFVGTGRYDLESIAQPDGSSVFSNPSFPDQGLVETATRTVQERQMKNLPVDREIREKELAEQLTDFFQKQPVGAKCFWTSPPGNKQDYQDQMSISYLGEIQSSETSSNDRKLHIELIVHKLSIPGQQQLLQFIDKQNHQAQTTDIDFVGNLYNLGKGNPVQSIGDVIEKVKELEEKGLSNPNAKPKEYVAKTILEDAKPQIREFCLFLEKVFHETYAAFQLHILQEDIQYFEEAYSLGHRSVVNFFRSKAEVSAELMYQDINTYRQLQAAGTIVEYNTEEEIDSYNMVASAFASQMEDRYGDDIDTEKQVGGGACPSGSLNRFRLNFISVGGVDYDLSTSSGNEVESIMECVECPFCHKTVDAIVTSTQIICPECKASVDKRD